MHKQSRPYVIAMATGDWHLWDTPPAYRSDEPDWWAAMQRPLDQLKAVWRKYHEPPILHGGDIFDSWKGSPELINWALRHVPPMYAVAGNHETPHHRYEDIRRSAYWTLVEAGRVVDLKPGVPHPLNGFVVHGFPFGTPVKSIASHLIDGFNVALVHSYIWKKGHHYTGAPEDKRVGAWEEKLLNFSHAFYSDNHSAFGYKGKHTTIINTGCVMRRRRDEAGYDPRVWLLWSDGEVSEEFLDCSADVYAKTEEAEPVVENNDVDVGELIESLGSLKQTKIDFVAVLEQVLKAAKAKRGVREKAIRATGG